jgi:tagatose-1,6-bisphosphate aldolase non-catalytic subunit AgaZ/GatZ
MMKTMMTIHEIIKKNIELRNGKGIKTTFLAVCPNSESVLAAGVKAAASTNSIMLFAATLNQVDLDGGYTGWTPDSFVREMQAYAKKYDCMGGLYPCLDHGGPWLKDKDAANNLRFEQTFNHIKESIEACIKAGYTLLHIDPTVDRDLPPGRGISVETVVDRSIELISFAEQARIRMNRPAISYEVGTEEVHGGMVDLEQFRRFVSLMQFKMAEGNLMSAWPSFFVAQVGTDLHTTKFDPVAAERITSILAPLGSLAKGHYSDWVENPGDYPQSGMGGANVGPEFTTEEYLALAELEAKEKALVNQGAPAGASRFMEVLTDAVVRSGRWKKWLRDAEINRDFYQLHPDRREWLVQTGARYIWTDPQVLEARKVLYQNVSSLVADPGEFVIDRIASSIRKYIKVFNLTNSLAVYS